MDLADANGWYPSRPRRVRGPGCRSTGRPGLTDLYMGDEAIVDCQTFSLKGKSMKSLRGAYNRVSKAGYRVDVHARAGGRARSCGRSCEDLATETRQGEAERGFSMTLSRMFDERDTGLLLAVCIDADGKPVAFNQYIPASHINGYSLDLMRRTSDPDAPNGLTDFVIIETINWMAERGLTGLGLNFATMRAVVAGETGSGPWRSAEKSLLHHFSESMQIESLWNFNKKYDPQWRPRYVGRRQPGSPAESGPGHRPGRVRGGTARGRPVHEAQAPGRRAPEQGACVMTTTIEPVTKTPADRSGARRLGVIGLALVLIAAMDSIRNLPTTATFGWSAIFFYGIAVLTYLVPVALCSAELATTVGGGMYRWVREAFGSRWGFLAVWCDWSENIVWFPTVLVFLATTVAYVINPDLSQNKAFLVPVMLVIFWAVTLVSLFGSPEVGPLDGRGRGDRDRRPDPGDHRPGPVVGRQRQAVANPLPRQRDRARLARPGQPRLRGRHRGRVRRHGDRWLLLPRDQERQAHLPQIGPGGRGHCGVAVDPGQRGDRDGRAAQADRAGRRDHAGGVRSSSPSSASSR